MDHEISGSTPEKAPSNKRALTIEKLKTFKGFEGITDEKARQVIDFLYQFCEILLNTDPSRFRLIQ